MTRLWGTDSGGKVNVYLLAALGDRSGDARAVRDLFSVALNGLRFETRRQAKDEIIDWLLWYNRTRLHSTLAYVSPMQFEQDWLANQPRQVNS